MAQLVVLGSLGAVLTVAAVVWRCRSTPGTSRHAHSGSARGLFRRVGGKSLPAEGFEDWKLHFVRIAISVLPPQRREAFGLQPQPQTVRSAAQRARTPKCR